MFLTRTPLSPVMILICVHIKSCIIRPLQATSGTRRRVELSTGDVLTPQESSRLAVAEAAVQVCGRG